MPGFFSGLLPGPVPRRDGPPFLPGPPARPRLPRSREPARHPPSGKQARYAAAPRAPTYPPRPCADVCGARPPAAQGPLHGLPPRPVPAPPCGRPSPAARPSAPRSPRTTGSRICPKPPAEGRIPARADFAARIYPAFSQGCVAVTAGGPQAPFSWRGGRAMFPANSGHGLCLPCGGSSRPGRCGPSAREFSQ